jgi:hypothetical protein
VIEFEVPSELICAVVQNRFPPNDTDCSETPEDSSISIESEEGCVISDADMEDGEFCFRAGEDDCVNIYLDQCGDPTECITQDDTGIIADYIFYPYTLPSNPFFMIVGDGDRDGDIDLDDYQLITFQYINNQYEGEYVADCVLIEDPGEETAEVEREDLGLRFCYPYPEEVELISLMIGDLNGDCACNEDYFSSSRSIPTPFTNHHAGELSGIQVVNKGSVLEIQIKSNETINDLKEIRLLTVSGQFIGTYSTNEFSNIYEFNLMNNFNGLYILQFITIEHISNYYIPSLL